MVRYVFPQMLLCLWQSALWIMFYMVVASSLISNHMGSLKALQLNKSGDSHWDKSRVDGEWVRSSGMNGLNKFHEVYLDGDAKNPLLKVEGYMQEMREYMSSIYGI